MILRTALTLFLATHASAFFVTTPFSSVRGHSCVSSLQVQLSDPSSSTNTGISPEDPGEEASEESNAVERSDENAVALTEEGGQSDLSDDKNGQDSKVLNNAERHTVYVGNLPFSTTVKEVREMFAEHVDVRYVSLPRNRETGSIKGFAFVDLGSPDEILKAIDALNEVDMDGRPLRVSLSLPKDQIRSTRKSTDGSKKLYVGNVPFASTKEELRDYFGQYGQVVDVFVPVNTYGDPRGFAFVSMKDDDVDATMEATNGVEFMGRALVVNIPLPPGEKPIKREMPGRLKLFVGNLAFHTSGDTLTEVFEEFGKVHDCYIPEDPVTSNSRGFGFITMDKDAASMAVDQLDGCELDGRIITCNEAKPRAPEGTTEDEDEASSADSEAESPRRAAKAQQ